MKSIKNKENKDNIIIARDAWSSGPSVQGDTGVQ